MPGISSHPSIGSMALAFSRRMPQLNLLALFAFIVALLSGIHTAANPVRFSFSGEEVHYGDNLHIVSSDFREGGVTSELNKLHRRDYQRLTDSSNDLGSIFTLISASGKSLGTTVHVNDTVYVDVFKFDKGLPFFWTWAKEGKTEFLRKTRTWAEEGATKFKIVASKIVPAIYPPVYWYQFESCPGSYCSGLSRYPENGVNYIKLGEKGSPRDLLFQFLPLKLPDSPRISMSTDT